VVLKINFSPQRNDKIVSVIKLGDILTVDGIMYNFNLINDGDTLPMEAVECEWIDSDVERINGEIELTLVRTYIEDTHENCFPEPIFDASDGVII